MKAERVAAGQPTELKLELSCREQALMAIDKLGPLASRQVPAAALLYIGQSFDWPEWLVRGTNMAAGRPIPVTITLAEDLILTGNLFDHLDPFEFVLRTIRLPSTGMGPTTAMAFQVAPTLDAALHASCRSLNVGLPHLTVNYRHDDLHGAVEVSSDYLRGQLLDGIAMGVLALLARLAESVVSQARNEAQLQLSAQLTATATADLTEIGSRIVFGADRNVLAYPTRLLKQPNIRTDPLLWNLVKHGDLAYGGSSHVSLSNQLAARVRRVLQEEHRSPRLKQLAEDFHLSERTIVRDLHAEGTSYRMIVDGERQLRALALVNDPALSLARVAAMLGFSDPASFWRTFKRWTGFTPAVYRHSHGMGASARR